ncbi:MAG: peptidoglycan-binding protein [Cyanothece sp. SIO2G6]|nr:peptidoglycan-binding protein [Cyanothece sp. SIO2G6]
METLGYLYHVVTYEANRDEGRCVAEPSSALTITQLRQGGIRVGGAMAVAIALLLSSPSASHAISSLRMGATSSDVVYVQNRLRSLGFFTARSTGYFGPITQDAVIRFQRANNLLVDGIVGPQTLRALNSGRAIAQPAIYYYSTIAPSTVTTVSTATPVTTSVIPPARPTTAFSANISAGNIGTELYKGSQGATVREIQTLLRQSGFYSGPITGYYGGLTAAAVEEFQRSEALPATGITGAKTLKRLIEAAH